MLDYGNGFTLLFKVCPLFLKKIVDTRKIVCALSILLRNKNTSSDTLYPGCQRPFSSAVSGISGTQGRYSIKFTLNNENKMYISKPN